MFQRVDRLHGDGGCGKQSVSQREQEGRPRLHEVVELLACELILLRLCSGQTPIRRDGSMAPAVDTQLLQPLAHCYGTGVEAIQLLLVSAVPSAFDS
jgi:hypothetical protein